MCGIAGVASAEPGFRPDVDTLRTMCNAIIIGPDDAGYYVSYGTGLGCEG